MKKIFLVILLVVVSVGCLARHQKVVDGPNVISCINEGEDDRALRGLICGLQQVFSYKDDQEPILEVRKLSPHATLYYNNKPNQWYRAVIVDLGDGKYYHLRVGFRYDVNWKGYIFPSIAAKETEMSGPY